MEGRESQDVISRSSLCLRVELMSLRSPGREVSGHLQRLGLQASQDELWCTQNGLGKDKVSILQSASKDNMKGSSITQIMATFLQHA